MPTSQTLRVNLGGEPDAIDPNLAEFTNEIAVVRQVFDTLVLLDKDLNPIPGAAASWSTSSDGITWTFKIRDHKYSDGTPVKAQDFVFSFKRELDPLVAAPYASYFAGVIKGSAAYNNAQVSVPKNATSAKPTVTPAELQKLADAVGVKAADDKTLVFTLEQPTPYFLDLVSLAVVPPLRQDLVKQGWVDNVKNYIGNGPFVMLEHVPQDHMLFAPNPNYWGGAPKIGLDYRIITDTNAAFAAYQNGELEIIVPPRANVPNIKQDPTLSKEFQVNPALTIYWLLYEMKHKPLDNQKFRQALSQAFDRESFIKDQFKGLGFPATYFIPKGMPGFDPNGGAEYAFNIGKAKASLQASGVNPASLSLKLLLTNNPVVVQYAQYIQAMIKKNIGVNIQPAPQEAKARVAAQKKHDFDLVWTGWGADYPDPQDWFDIYLTGGGNNNGEYSNKQYDDLVKKADVEGDPKKRADLYSQAAKILYADQPALIMYQDVNFGLVKSYVHNLVPTAQDEILGDYFYKNVTIASH
ncbi:MAG: peptide ABC transporter substrate-binding protein [Chloroflexi bacterium]|nr:peptide ABC transporter substrate-binding protein [Chloroflexota bacterium]